MPTPKILLVDDDIELCALLNEFLSGEGFDVTAVHGGNEAIATIQAQSYDAVVLDIMMPQTTGLDVLREVRRKSHVPIIMLTGRGDDIDRILGLEMGADDYLGKPCNPRELAARLRAVLRRTHALSTSHTPQQSITLHGITLHPSSMSIEFESDQQAEFTSVEFRILQLLMESAGKTLSKSELTEQALQRKLSAHDRSIDVHISRIRQKLATLKATKDIIKSVRGVGYQMILHREQND